MSAAIPSTPDPRKKMKTLDDSDIARLETELQGETEKCNEKADAAIESVTRLQKRIGGSGRVRLRTPAEGTRVRTGRTPRPMNGAHGSPNDETKLDGDEAELTPPPPPGR